MPVAGKGPEGPLGLEEQVQSTQALQINLGRLVVDPLVGCKAPVFGETNIEPLTTQGVADVAAATSPPRGRPSRSHRR